MLRGQAEEYAHTKASSLCRDCIAWPPNRARCSPSTLWIWWQKEDGASAFLNCYAETNAMVPRVQLFTKIW